MRPRLVVTIAVWAALVGRPLSAQSGPGLRLEELPLPPGMPTSIVHAGDGSGRLFVSSKQGRISIYDSSGLRPTPFLDIRSKVTFNGERGLLGLAFDPNYVANGRFYVSYTNLQGNIVIARYSVSSADPNVAIASELVLLTIPHPLLNHYGGQLQFGPDGYLYIGIGDGGGEADPDGNGQRLNTLLGKILRIDVDPAFSYAIPSNNPFVSTTGARPEIWAYGLRNPWRFSFDRDTGDLFIADVGEHFMEEVNFQAAGDPGGQNYGWRITEGSRCFETLFCNRTGLTPPVMEYDHGRGCSVIGGYRYRGTAVPGLAGTYLFADYCFGPVWGARRASNGSWAFSLLMVTETFITTFGEDEDGEVYVGDGNHVYKIVTGPPALSVSDARVIEGDSASRQATFTVLLLPASTVNVTVHYQTSNQSATAGTDYSARSGQLTFLPGETEKRIDVPVFGDTTFEGDERFVFELSSPFHATIVGAGRYGYGTIVDDDSGLTIADVNVFEGPSGTTDAVFTVRLLRARETQVTVDFATVDGTAVAGTDYTAVSGSLTFEPGETTATLSVPIIGDDLVEPTKTFSVQLSNAVGVPIVRDLATGTITNDDNGPSISASDVAVAEGDSGSVEATFAVSLSRPSAQTITVNYSASSWTARVGDDFVNANGVLTFEPGVIAATVSVSVLGDVLDEDDEISSSVSTRPPTRPWPVPGRNDPGRRPDPDPGYRGRERIGGRLGNSRPFVPGHPVGPERSLHLGALRHDFGDGYRGTLPQPPGGDSFITFTGQAASPYPSTISVPAFSGQVTKVRVRVSLGQAGRRNTRRRADWVDRDAFGRTSGPECSPDVGRSRWLRGRHGQPHLRRRWSAAPRWHDRLRHLSTDELRPAWRRRGIRTASAQWALRNDAIGVPGTESSRCVASLRLRRLGPRNLRRLPFDMDLRDPHDGRLLPGGGSFLISPGLATASLNIPLFGDTTREPDETFSVDLGTTPTAIVVAGHAVGTILNDDMLQLRVGDLTVIEGDSGATDAIFTVTLDQAGTTPVTVDYATVDASATAADEDYSAVSGTLTFEAGTTSLTIRVPIMGDVWHELDETFALALSNAAGASLARPTGVAFIPNDDPMPVLSVTDVLAVEGTTAAFVFSLSAPSRAPVTVAYSTSGGTASAGIDYTPTTGTLVFPSEVVTQTVSVPLLADIPTERSESFLLQLSAVAHATLARSAATGWILDPGTVPRVQFASTSYATTEAARAVSILVRRTGDMSQSVGLAYEGSDGSARNGVNYTSVSGILTFPPRVATRSFSVPIINEPTVNGPTTVLLSLREVEGPALLGTPNTAVLTIADNDRGGSLAFFGSAFVANETGGSATITVRRAGGAAGGVTVDYGTLDDTGTAGVDYQATSGTLSFGPGVTRQTFTVPILADSQAEGDEAVAMTLSNPVGGAGLGAPSSAALIISDAQAAFDFAQPGFTAREQAPRALIAVERTGPATGTATVDYATSNGSAEAGVNYTPASGTLTFGPGMTTRTFGWGPRQSGGRGNRDGPPEPCEPERCGSRGHADRSPLHRRQRHRRYDPAQRELSGERPQHGRDRCRNAHRWHRRWRERRLRDGGWHCGRGAPVRCHLREFDLWPRRHETDFHDPASAGSKPSRRRNRDAQPDQPARRCSRRDAQHRGPHDPEHRSDSPVQLGRLPRRGHVAGGARRGHPFGARHGRGHRRLRHF